MNSKLPNTPVSIFSVMSAMARENNALNLSQGFPNFDIDPELHELVSDAMRRGDNQYAPMPGLLRLRERISEKVFNSSGRTYDPTSEITVTAGATQAIYTAITALVHSGDEVLIFAPAYDCYEPAIILQGAKAVAVQLEAPEYRINWEQVQQHITSKTRMIVVNTPHNPSGTLMSESDMKQLERIALAHNLWVLSDEVYEHIVFDGQAHYSAAAFEGLANRSIITASFGKTFHTTGWKMGYCLAPKALMDEFRKVHQYLVFSVNHPMQQALATYLEEPSRYTSLGAFYQKKRDLFLQGLEGTDFKAIPSGGTYFQMVDYSEVSRQYDVDFARFLTEEYGLAAIPTSVFNLEKKNHFMLRFCFAKTEETLEQATEIIQKIQPQLASR
ncbi:methionine aminotransferase [Gilvibacter sp.]|uniref:methionine aminotransferase n=1 Tax=Gilvibacter sp. TaxID=2729997 RepID=UPI003F4A3B62